MNRNGNWERARTIRPADGGFVVIAVRSGAWSIPPAIPWQRRTAALRGLRELAGAIHSESRVVSASTFRGTVRPPGDRSLPGQWRGPVEYDAVLLAQTTDLQSAEELIQSSKVTIALEEFSEAVALAGFNARRIADVDHSRPGVFLFNFFTADTAEANLDAWQHTAGWFQDVTGLDNSTVIRPTSGATEFTLINHCRWDHYAKVLPALMLRPSFRTFVLNTFRTQAVAPHPALYALDRHYQ
jgi:hypothetical protein